MFLKRGQSLRTSYRVMKSSDKSFSDQPLHPSKKKLHEDLTWNRLNVLYQFREYLRNQLNLPNHWIRLLKKAPGAVEQSSCPKTSNSEPNNNDSSNIIDDKDHRLFDTSTIKKIYIQETEKTENVNMSDNLRHEMSYNLPLMSEWRNKNIEMEGDKMRKQNVVEDWRNRIPHVANTTMTTKVQHLLFLIENAQTVPSRLKRLEDLIAFLMHNPDARLIAVKEGAIKKLLHVRRVTKDHATHQILREIFALFGHVSPLRCRGIRILSIDGGGIRGIAVVDMLRKLEELTGKRIYELFDYICGVSTGSILVSCIGTPQGLPLDEVSAMYEEFGTKLFTQSAFWGFSNLVLGRAYYDTNMFEDLLKRFVGQMPMIQTNRDAKCPKLASISTVMNRSSIMPFVFRNYALPCDRQSQFLGSCNYTLYEAVRASGAAPTVFQEFCLDGMIHQDGGILVNNPCAVAIHEAKLLWPNNEIQCVVSCGTGRHAPISVATDLLDKTANVSSISWKTLFNRILESATDTEGVHTMLNDLLPPGVYFRFNPYLTSIIPMHENKCDKMAQLRDETNLYIRRNEEKFVDAATSLLIKRTVTQKLRDFIDSKCFEYGLKNSAFKV